MKRYLILGCGYVGRAFARSVVAAGDSVVAVTRNEDTVKQLRSEGVDAHVGRVDSSDWHEVVGGGFDVALNCVSSAGNGLVGYRESYVGGNTSFVNWMELVGFSGRAIYTSSVSVYPDSGGKWVNEGDARGSSERGEIVLESEKVFLEGGAFAADRTVLRLAGIYGPERHMLLNRVKVGDGVISGSGAYYLNLVRLEDIVSALWAVCDFEGDGLGGVYNVVDDCPTPKGEIISWMAEQLKREAPCFGQEGGERGASRRFSSSGRGAANRRVSNALIRGDLGWRPRFEDFRKGFREFIV